MKINTFYENKLKLIYTATDTHASAIESDTFNTVINQFNICMYM